MSKPRIWLITGASQGLGRSIALEALSRGDFVVVTSRDRRRLGEITEKNSERVLPIELHLNDEKSIESAFQIISEKTGHIDILVNNAGYLFANPIELTSNQEVRGAFDVNFFGPLRVLQKSLEMMRENSGGHIFQISSAYSYGPGMGSGIYAAAKSAFESIHISTQLECEKFGINVTIVQPGIIKSDFLQSSLIRGKAKNPYYQHVEDRIDSAKDRLSNAKGVDSDLIAKCIFQVSTEKKPPTYLVIGEDAIQHRKNCIDRQSTDCDFSKSLRARLETQG